MKKIISKVIISLFLFVTAQSVFAQETLKPKIVEKLQQNVFEVVFLKIEDDPLTYEKELPLDRIPYQIRMDKYDSIGTAFLLKDGRFYTAAHVLSLQFKTQANKFFIRSQDKKIYKITNIVKFATDRDFVVFEVEGFDDPKAKGLEYDTNYKQNSTVFAVGNAQGEGIVMRNGLLTSTTPENRAGKWQWLRFSAAASPGNSGGPLVTQQGKVIGIVAMKNSSENLNYALPIKETENIPDNKGEIHTEAYYNIPNITKQKFYHTFDYEMELPKPIDEVREICYNELYKYTSDFFDKTASDFRFTGKESFTQNDKGNTIFSNFYTAKFPLTLCLNDKNKWSLYSPQKTSDLKLEKNGNITIGAMLGIIMTKLKKPDDISVQQYIENPKLLMDTLEKVLVLSRSFGTEKIIITSFGEPVYTSTYLDSFERTWIISAYNVPFADYVIYNLSLPLPDGIYTMTGFAPTHHIWCGFNFDMAFLADNTIAGYNGTYKELEEYLNIPESVYPRHKVLQNTVVSNSNKEFKISTSYFEFSIPASVTKIDDDSDISLGLCLRPESKKGLTSEVAMTSVETQKKTNDNTIVLYTKQYKPHEDSSKDTIDSYEKVCQKTIPYDSNPYENNQKTSIFTADVKDDSVTVLGVVYKGSKKDIIKNSLDIIHKTLKEK